MEEQLKKLIGGKITEAGLCEDKSVLRLKIKGENVYIFASKELRIDANNIK